MAVTHVEIEVEELVLSGPGREFDADAFGQAVRSELERLLGERTPGARLELLVDEPRLEMSWSSDPVTLGRSLARTLHGGLQG